MLETLNALEETQRKVATKLRDRLADQPAPDYDVEEIIRKVDGKIDRKAEVLRHCLMVDDSVLSSRGVRPWEGEQH